MRLYYLQLYQISLWLCCLRLRLGLDHCESLGKVCVWLLCVLCSRCFGLFSLIYHYFHKWWVLCGYWYTPKTSALFESWLVSNKQFAALICNFLISSQLNRSVTSALEKSRLLDPGFVVFALIRFSTSDSFMTTD